MKIIFLDIDGVLNCETTKERHCGCIGIEPAKVELFNKILEKTGAMVVLSSTWRLDAQSRAEVKKYVDYFDITPEIEGKSRGKEIESWIEKHNVDKYAIIDDDDDMIHNQKRYFFQTTFKEGLTANIANSVIKFLNH